MNNSLELLTLALYHPSCVHCCEDVSVGAKKEGVSPPTHCFKLSSILRPTGNDVLQFNHLQKIFKAF